MTTHLLSTRKRFLYGIAIIIMSLIIAAPLIVATPVLQKIPPLLQVYNFPIKISILNKQAKGLV